MIPIYVWRNSPHVPTAETTCGADASGEGPWLGWELKSAYQKLVLLRNKLVLTTLPSNKTMVYPLVAWLLIGLALKVDYQLAGTKIYGDYICQIHLR